MELSLQSERDKMLWTDRDMWKAGIIGVLFGVLLMLAFSANAGDKHRHKKLPPNCAMINGQLRCWVIDPLPPEEE